MNNSSTQSKIPANKKHAPSMKIGITYLYTISRYGYPPKVTDDFKALAEIEKMGFHFLEMESLGQDHLEGVWKHRQDFRKCLDDHGIHVHNFCSVDSDLVSLDARKRREAYKRFRKSVELAAFLGTETIHLASYAPPVKYVGHAPYQLGKKYRFGNTFQVQIPHGFSWEKVWTTLVESCTHAADICREFNRTVIMEPRVGEVICSVDSMIRLIHDVGRVNFKANFDTAHFSAQRENVPLALEKLKGHFANIHLSDNDPISPDHLPIGKGIIDWNEFFRILKLQGYQGYLGLDLARRESLVADLKQSVQKLKKIAAQENITLLV